MQCEPSPLFVVVWVMGLAFLFVVGTFIVTETGVIQRITKLWLAPVLFFAAVLILIFDFLRAYFEEVWELVREYAPERISRAMGIYYTTDLDIERYWEFVMNLVDDSPRPRAARRNPAAAADNQGRSLLRRRFVQSAQARGVA